MKPVCGECFWVWPFHAPWCSKDCRFWWLFPLLVNACVLDTTPNPSTCRALDASVVQDSGK